MKMSDMCVELKKKIEQDIANFNAAWTAGDAKAMAAAEESIKKNEKEFASQAQLDLFSAHKGDENPIYEVLKVGSYGVMRHKPVREEGSLICWELNPNAEKQVDIGKMFTYFGRQDKVWEYRAYRLTELLCEWAAEEVRGNADGIRDTFKMSKHAKEIEVGPKPTSNTSMLKFLQSCIDEVVGAGMAKANNRDLKFLQHCYTREGSGMNNLATLKGNGVIRVLGKIIYRIANDYAYTIDFKKIVAKDAALEAQKAANQAAKDAKAQAQAEKPEEAVVVTREEAAA